MEGIWGVYLMAELIVAYIILNENNIWFKASLQSILHFADKVLIVDGGSIDGTLDLIDSFHSDKINVVHSPWQNNDGHQRNQYLKFLNMINDDNTWVLVLDADEVLSDNGGELKIIANKCNEKGPFVFSPRMEHFIWNLKWVNSRLPKHYVPRRFFKFRPCLFYETTQHPILRGFNEQEAIPDIDEITIFHYGACRGVEKAIKMYPINLKRSQMHSPEFAKELMDWEVWGSYPVKESPYKLEDHPLPIQNLLMGKE